MYSKNKYNAIYCSHLMENGGLDRIKYIKFTPKIYSEEVKERSCQVITMYVIYLLNNMAKTVLFTFSPGYPSQELRSTSRHTHP